MVATTVQLMGGTTFESDAQDTAKETSASETLPDLASNEPEADSETVPSGDDTTENDNTEVAGDETPVADNDVATESEKTLKGTTPDSDSTSSDVQNETTQGAPTPSDNEAAPEDTITIDGISYTQVTASSVQDLITEMNQEGHYVITLLPDIDYTLKEAIETRPDTAFILKADTPISIGVSSANRHFSIDGELKITSNITLTGADSNGNAVGGGIEVKAGATLDLDGCKIENCIQEQGDVISALGKVNMTNGATVNESADLKNEGAAVPEGTNPENESIASEDGQDVQIMYKNMDRDKDYKDRDKGEKDRDGNRDDSKGKGKHYEDNHDNEQDVLPTGVFDGNQDSYKVLLGISVVALLALGGRIGRREL